jgi:hypothetical protein
MQPGHALARERNARTGDAVGAPPAAADCEKSRDGDRNYDTGYTPFSHFQRPFVSLH